MKPIVLIDLDGTLSDVAHRLPLIDRRPPDWDAFHRACVDDPPNIGTVLWSQGLGMDYDLYITSGRSALVREETKTWLASHGIPYSELLMREQGDYRSDDTIKRDMLLWIRAEGRKIAFVIDDRPSVVSMWRSEGLKVFPVHQDRWDGRP